MGHFNGCWSNYNPLMPLSLLINPLFNKRHVSPLCPVKLSSQMYVTECF